MGHFTRPSNDVTILKNVWRVFFELTELKNTFESHLYKHHTNEALTKDKYGVYQRFALNRGKRRRKIILSPFCPLLKWVISFWGGWSTSKLWFVPKIKLIEFVQIHPKVVYIDIGISSYLWRTFLFLSLQICLKSVLFFPMKWRQRIHISKYNLFLF